MEAQNFVVNCPKHPSEPIQRINPEFNASQHLFCLECVLENKHIQPLQTQLVTIQDFLGSAAGFYEREKETVRTASEVPRNLVEELSTKKEVLENLQNNLEMEKKRVEKTFNILIQSLTRCLEQKKQGFIRTLDQQISNLQYWYISLEKQFRKAYPTDEDISYLFPTKEELDQRLHAATDINELTALVRGIKEDMNEHQLKTRSRLDKYENRKARVTELSAKLSQIKTRTPYYGVDYPQLENVGTEIEKYLNTYLNVCIILQDPIGDPLPTQIGTQMIDADDYETIQRWLPPQYQSYSPQLLYSGKRDGLENQAFHQKCDHKGPTITLIKCLLNESEERIIGGFLDQSWNSNSLYIRSEEAFLFSVTEKFKCRILEHGKSHAAHGSRNTGPAFGKGDLVIMNGNVNVINDRIHGQQNLNLYSNSGNLLRAHNNEDISSNTLQNNFQSLLTPDSNRINPSQSNQQLTPQFIQKTNMPPQSQMMFNSLVQQGPQLGSALQNIQSQKPSAQSYQQQQKPQMISALQSIQPQIPSVQSYQQRQQMISSLQNTQSQNPSVQSILNPQSAYPTMQSSPMPSAKPSASLMMDPNSRQTSIKLKEIEVYVLNAL